MKLRELAARLLLPVRMVNSFLETEGVFILNENEYVRAVDVEHLVLKLCGNAGFRGFQQVAKSSIRLNALANYLGQRPSVLARDLKLDQLALASHTCVPYKTIVQLCFYYGKRLPIPVTKKRSK